MSRHKVREEVKTLTNQSHHLRNGFPIVIVLLLALLDGRLTAQITTILVVSDQMAARSSNASQNTVQIHPRTIGTVLVAE